MNNYFYNHKVIKFPVYQSPGENLGFQKGGANEDIYIHG